MPKIIESWGANDIFTRAVSAIQLEGAFSNPRGIPTRELRNVIIQLGDPRRSMLNTAIRPKYHPVIGIAEGLQLISGTSCPDLMVRISSAFAQFREEDGGLHGAYGPRLADDEQLRKVVDLLKEDPDSRQAVAAIWQPELDGYSQHVPKDVPCTVDLVFSIRGNQLRLDTHMRSNDAWLGLPYDLMQFTILQTTVGNILAKKYGKYTHYVNSLHVYERDFSKIPEPSATMPFETADITGLPATSWHQAEDMADALLQGGQVPGNSFTNMCHRLLRPYLSKAH